MKRSAERILTTHVGSLPRPDDLVELIVKELHGDEIDRAVLEKRISEAVIDIVRRQRDIGIDIVCDGEMSKPGFSNYIINRYSGFGGSPISGVPEDLVDFPNVKKKIWSDTHADTRSHLLLECVGPIELRDQAALERDINNLKDAIGGSDPQDAFMTAVTPGQITFNFPNRYYPSHEAYIQAAAEAMRTEYKAITDAGFTLQLDAPDAALSAHIRWGSGADMPEFQKHLALAIEALNYSVEGISPDQMRLHVCWGNYVGPHHRDIPLKKILSTILKARPNGLTFEAANPRHEHEWEVFKEVRVPAGKLLIPGVIDTKTHHIEHPRLISQRLQRYASIVGRENVIAANDCGFSTWVGQCLIDIDVAWAKLQAMVEGARDASEELWRIRPRSEREIVL